SYMNTEQKLSGHFDPPSVMAKGYCEESFIPGPLIEAIRLGGVLLINEMNRLPEGVQNVLLPALDEGIVSVPRLGKIQARPGFVVIATQNPKEFVATAQLSEAILDRFEWVSLGYQSQNEEIEIVLEALSKLQGVTGGAELASQAVAVVRATRNDPRVRRGASVRAAIAIAEVAAIWVAEGKSVDEAIQLASKTGLPTRMEWAESAADPSEREKALDSFMKVEQVKKKN
ncbi:MoxR family ATPase, partial [bacterium]|nr:MoxR family ATPase [bacterium]